MGVTVAAEQSELSMETPVCDSEGTVLNYLKADNYVFKPSLRMEVSVQSFVDEKINHVPEVFVKTVESVALSNSVDGGVPTIDMAAPDAAEKIVRACSEWGAFQGLNHGIPKELMERAERLSDKYFSMPKDDIIPDKRVFLPQDGSRDWSDCALHFLVPIQEDNEMRTKWPENYRETLTEFVDESIKLVTGVMRTALSPGLGVPPDRLLEAVGGDIHVAVRVNHYPPCPQPDRVLGLTSHTDHGIATVLVQNDVPGLQIYNSGKWFTVKPLKDSIIFLVTNMLEVMSNGTYKSVVHRAIVNEHRVRTSMAVFHNMKSEIFVEPLPELLDEDHPPIYQRVQFGASFNGYERLGLDGRSFLDTLLLNQRQNVHN